MIFSFNPNNANLDSSIVIANIKESDDWKYMIGLRVFKIDGAYKAYMVWHDSNGDYQFDWIGDDGGEAPQNPGYLIVSYLQEVRDGELGQFSGPRGHEIENDDRHPDAGVKPQGGETLLVAQPSAGDDAPRSDPGGQKRSHQHRSREPPAGHHEIGLGLHPPGADGPHANQD